MENSQQIRILEEDICYMQRAIETTSGDCKTDIDNFKEQREIFFNHVNSNLFGNYLDVAKLFRKAAELNNQFWGNLGVA